MKAELGKTLREQISTKAEKERTDSANKRIVGTTE